MQTGEFSRIDTRPKPRLTKPRCKTTYSHTNPSQPTVTQSCPLLRTTTHCCKHGQWQSTRHTTNHHKPPGPPHICPVLNKDPYPNNASASFVTGLDSRIANLRRYMRLLTTIAYRILGHMRCRAPWRASRRLTCGQAHRTTRIAYG